ncbi:hypothetical protein HanLR1_Chr01g0034881 [Helianthus annuus]|nr:hypothetical protein HanLR1_Chr01g0034881 [Helianthus annuus]
MLSFQYHCSNIVVSMKLPITHQPFNIDVAVSLLQHREKLHVLPSLMGELHCLIFVKSKVRFSCVRKNFSFYRKYRFVQYREKSDVLQQLRRDLCILETLLHSSGTLMEESGGLHREMLCCSRQIEEQVYEDRVTLQELKRCFDGLQVGLFTREQVSRDLMRMPSTSVYELCVVSNIECGDRDVEFMAMLKDIHREVQQSMELKLKFNSVKGWFDGEQIMLMLNCSIAVAQTSVVERTAPGDHDTTIGVMKHTLGKRKKKAVTSKKPIKTKQNKKVPLEDEIPEVNEVTTQMSLETTAATSSQLLERSQPIQTPHVSSQKDHVVSTWTPQHEVDLSYESMFKSPSPRAITLSTPQPLTQVPSTILPLFEAIKFQKENSSSNAHITESRSQQLTVSEQIQSPILQTVEEVIPVEYYETLGGGSSGAATTTVEPIGDQLDSGYIIKTPLKATTDEVTTVISASVGSPQNEEKGAFVSDDMETSPIIKTNTTTTGGNSDDPIKVGDELTYKDLTVRVSTIETDVIEMKELIKQMIELFKSQPTRQEIANELWNSMQPILQAQRNLAESNRNFSLNLSEIWLMPGIKTHKQTL